jgi:hypothetical protein
VDQFLIEGVTAAGAQDLLPQYLAKCADSATQDKMVKVVARLAELAWSSAKFTTTNYEWDTSALVFKVDIAKHFFEVVLSQRQYGLFNKAVGWLRKQAAILGVPLFELVSSKLTEEGFDFASITDRYVFHFDPILID